MTTQTRVETNDGPAELDFFHSSARRSVVHFTIASTGEKLPIVITGIVGQVGSIRQWTYYGYVSKDSKDSYFPKYRSIQGFLDYRHGRKGYIKISEPPKTKITVLTVAGTPSFEVNGQCDAADIDAMVRDEYGVQANKSPHNWRGERTTYL